MQPQQMSDPLTTLMHAVQVMNLLKTLIIKTLRDRDDEETCTYSPCSSCTMLSEQEIDNNSNNYNDEGYSSYTKDKIEIETSYSSEVEDCDSLGEIKDCFLKRLERKEEEGNLDRSAITDCEARLDGKCVTCRTTLQGLASQRAILIVRLLQIRLGWRENV
jgi:hypothetical protein